MSKLDETHNTAAKWLVIVLMIILLPVHIAIFLSGVSAWMFRWGDNQLFKFFE